MLREWAALVRALVDGRIAVLLRAGGLHEPDGAGRFRMDRTEFGLLPTYLHQRPQHLAPEFRPERFGDMPEAVDVEAVAGVRRVFRVEDEALLGGVSRLSGHQLDYARERFWFRQPGVLAVLVEVYRVVSPRRLVLGPEHAGCRSWLEIDPPVETAGATRAMPEPRLKTIEAELAALVDESGRS